MLAGPEACPAEFIEEATMRIAAQVRSSFDDLCFLCNLELLATITFKAQKDDPHVAETLQSHSYPLTSIEPAFRKMRPWIFTLRPKSFEL